MLKPGDLIRINSPRRATRDFSIADGYHDRTGIIVSYVTQATEDTTWWNVLVDGVIFMAREPVLEAVNETG